MVPRPGNQEAHARRNGAYFAEAQFPSLVVYWVRMTDEHQDIIFGSEGTAQADFERMDEINYEIGLTQMLRGSPHGAGSDIDHIEKEKTGAHLEKSD